MSRFLLFFALAFVASVRPGIGSDEGTTACLFIVDAALYDVEYLPRSVELCNANEHCLDAKRFIGQQHGKTIPELTCAGVRESSSQAATKFFNDIYGNACDLAGIALVGGGRSGESALQKQIALCNQHPDKSRCHEVKSFVESTGKKPGGLTCE